MKKVYKPFVFLVLFLLLVSVACGGSASTSPSSASLFVVVGNSAARFAGNGNGDGLLLDQFAKKNQVDLYVEIVNDRQLDDYRKQMLENQSGAPDVLICDDSLGCDGLQNVKLIASHKVGAAIREDIANQAGFQSNITSYTNFINSMKMEQLQVVASNAMAGYASLEFFFSTMAWCSQTDSANLTADIVRREDVRVCGKDVYDHIKSTNGSQEALDLVYNNAVSGDPNGFNAVITFDSDLLGDNGLNAKLTKEGKPIFKFFYFIEATAKANVGIGTRKFSDEANKESLASSLISFLQEDASQNFINLAGFTEGSSVLVYHNDAAFIPEWGVASNPSGVQVVNAPISAVAENAKQVYAQLYKRAKEIVILGDVSGSTQNEDVLVKLPENFDPPIDAQKYCGDAASHKAGETYYISRIQAISCGIETFTNQSWIVDNGVPMGPGDKIEFRFFSDTASELIAQSIGSDTMQAGEKVLLKIGPAHGPYDLLSVQNKIDNILSWDNRDFSMNGTQIFDAAKYATDQILTTYDPNKDYYVVILTDGENMGGWNSDQYFEYWQSLNKPNIVLIGIQFGGDTSKSDVKATYTEKFGGNSYEGTNNAQLIEAFKSILGN